MEDSGGRLLLLKQRGLYHRQKKTSITLEAPPCLCSSLIFYQKLCPLLKLAETMGGLAVDFHQKQKLQNVSKRRGFD